MSRVEERVDRLEEALMKLAYAQFNTEMELRQLSQEMKDFKTEMQAFKDEMQAFKDEMKDFKAEMQAFKEEVRRDRKAMNKRWGEIANKLGTVVEDIMYPSARRVARTFFGAKVIEFEGQRIVRRLSGDRGRSREFDGVFAWEGHVLLLEGKAAIRPEYLRGFADFVRLGVFFDWFPEYRGRRLIPVFGALAISDQDVAWLTRRRIYVLKMGEEAMELVNFEAVERERAD